MSTIEPTAEREPRTSFTGINPQHSAEIYRQLVAGRVVLRQTYNGHKAALEDNPLYNVLYNNLSHFRELYRHLGLELVFHNQGGFFYLREGADDDSEEHDENALKVQVVLLVIGRYFTRTGRDLQYLGRLDAGLKDEDLAALAADDEYADILRAARFAKGWEEALNYLVSRSFAFQTGASRYALSSAGMCFLEQLIQEYEHNCD
ncbi:MAG: hypothetical protein WED00_16455 [Aquisalimonadaceae bacterium]